MVVSFFLPSTKTKTTAHQSSNPNNIVPHPKNNQTQVPMFCFYLWSWSLPSLGARVLIRIAGQINDLNTFKFIKFSLVNWKDSAKHEEVGLLTPLRTTGILDSGHGKTVSCAAQLAGKWPYLFVRRELRERVSLLWPEFWGLWPAGEAGQHTRNWGKKGSAYAAARCSVVFAESTRLRLKKHLVPKGRWRWREKCRITF